MKVLVLILISLPIAYCRHAPLFDGTDATLPKNLKKDSVMDKIEKINRDQIKGREKKNQLFEIDMKLSSSLKEAVNTKNTSKSDNAKVKVESVTRRTGVRRRSQVWTTRVIPLEITKPVADDGEKNIWDATKEIEKNSCLKFRRKKSGDKNWIKIIKGEGCSSFVGRVNIKDGQPLSLGEGCNDKAVALHEILHAVGFYHEQSRTDRDDYINILWENIYEGAEGQFNKIGAEEMDMVGGTYDYNSIMHYGNNVFSKNDKPTMIAIKDPSKVLGTKGAKLNAVDILQINNLYNCKTKSGSWSDWSDWGPCDLGCERKRERFCFDKSKKGCPKADENGIETERSKCEKDECNVPVPGHWGRWGPWAKCSKTCGQGYTTRSRVCNNPEPQKDGKFCEGPLVETADCHIEKTCKT